MPRTYRVRPFIFGTMYASMTRNSDDSWSVSDDAAQRVIVDRTTEGEARALVKRISHHYTHGNFAVDFTL